MKILRSVQGRNLNRHSQAWQRGRNGFIALLTLLGASLYAQTDTQTTLLAPQAAQFTPVKLSPEDLNQLLAPVALYPDALIALILPASTVPSDVVLGARYVQANGDPDQVGNQPWDDSVKSLTRYPDVLKWMDQNLEWTSSVGEAFVSQPADVMDAIQRLRAQAKAEGNLQDTPQQRVVQEDRDIRIIPADPQVIYVPVYDPQVVYVQPYSPGLPPLLTFGLGFAVGSWLNYDFDWGHRCFYRGNWNNYGWNNNNWNHGGGWNNGGGSNVNVVNITNNNVSQWQPSTASRQQLARRQLNHTGNARFVNSATSANVRAPGSVTAAAGTTATNTVHHRNELPRPTRLHLANQGEGRNRVSASASAPQQTQVTAAGTAKTDRHGHVSAPTTAPSLTSATAQTTTEAVNPGGHRIVNTPTEAHHGGSGGTVAPTTAAPQVPGQLAAPANNPDKSTRHDHKAAGSESVQSAAPAPANPHRTEHASHSSSPGAGSAAPQNVPTTEAPRVSQPQAAPRHHATHDQSAPSSSSKNSAPVSEAPRVQASQSSSHQNHDRASSSESHAASQQSNPPREHHSAPSGQKNEQSSSRKSSAPSTQTKSAPSHDSSSNKGGGSHKKSDNKNDKNQDNNS